MNSLKEYGELFQSLKLTELSVTQGDFQITMKRETQGCISNNLQKNVGETSVERVAGEEQLPTNLDEVKAPLLGIFHAGSDQSAPIQVGDSVKKGDVLCTIEAMTMFNEVTAPVDGVLREICVKNGELVEYDRTLFLIER